MGIVTFLLKKKKKELSPQAFRLWCVTKGQCKWALLITLEGVPPMIGKNK